jgi:hypothetical protein
MTDAQTIRRRRHPSSVTTANKNELAITFFLCIAFACCALFDRQICHTQLFQEFLI